MEIGTKRLRLIPLDLENLILLLRDYQQLERNLSLTITDNQLEGSLNKVMGVLIARVRANPKDYLWYTNWIIVLRTENKIIGGLGFKGIPDEKGIVEIGYGINPPYQNNGYMTEAAEIAVKWALTQPNVKIVTAQTLRTNSSSRRVLEKIGMVLYNISEEYLYWNISLDRMQRKLPTTSLTS